MSATERTEMDQYLLEGSGEIHDSGMQRDGDGTTSRTWSLTWPEQRDRGISAVELVAWFGGSFHHPHLRGATVRDWALNVYAEPDAQDLLPVLRAVVAADVHNLIFQADWQIIRSCADESQPSSVSQPSMSQPSMSQPSMSQP
jgi:hypothetical protein